MKDALGKIRILTIRSDPTNPESNDYEQHMLHEYGFAREYPISGVYESKMTWTKGERFDVKSIWDI